MRADAQRASIRRGTIALAVAALALPGLAAAVDEEVHEYVEIALEHIEYASAAADVEQKHEHLKHVINCLAGPEDDAYREEAANPCEGLGEGLVTALEPDRAFAPARGALLHIDAILQIEDPDLSDMRIDEAQQALLQVRQDLAAG